MWGVGPTDDTELLQQRWLVLEALSLEAWPMFEAAEVRGRLRDEHLARVLSLLAEVGAGASLLVAAAPARAVVKLLEVLAL